MKNKITMPDVFKNPKYRGKHVILAAGKIYTAKTGDGAVEILRKLEKTHPDITPEVAYMPKARSLNFNIFDSMKSRHCWVAWDFWKRLKPIL